MAKASAARVPPQISTYCEVVAEESAETAIIGGGEKKWGGEREREKEDNRSARKIAE